MKRLSTTARTLGLLLITSFAVGNAACIKKMILNGQIKATREAAAGVSTVHDFEVANTMAYAGLAQFEGFHVLAPQNEDALFLLTKGWTSSAFAFMEDKLERIEDSAGVNSEEYTQMAERTRAGYERGIEYGIKLLELRNPGFEAARQNDASIKTWLARFESKADAESLFWFGYAWMGRANIAKDDPEIVAELFVGEAIMNRVLQLDESVMNGSAHVVLGSYHARTALAELDEAKIAFDRALAMTDGKMLMAKLQYAIRYDCMTGNKEHYLQLLNEVVAAGNVFPAEQLSNVLAKRRASRYLQPKRMQESCGFEP